jgi:hypothetical protein
LASGTSAPLWSNTLPPKLAVVYWAHSGEMQNRIQTVRPNNLIDLI